MKTPYNYTLLGSNDTMEAFRKDGGFEGPTIMLHHLLQPDFRAGFAMELMKTNSVLLGHPDGEDSSGRQKLATTPPAEVVRRACEIADEAHQQFVARGWLLDLGSFPVAPENDKPEQE